MQNLCFIEQSRTFSITWIILILNNHSQLKEIKACLVAESAVCQSLVTKPRKSRDFKC